MTGVLDRGQPLSRPHNTLRSMALLRQMETAEPDFVAPHRYLAEIFAIAGNYSDSFSERRKMDLLLQDRSDLAVADAAERGLATGGAKGMLESMLSAGIFGGSRGHQRTRTGDGCWFPRCVRNGWLCRIDCFHLAESRARRTTHGKLMRRIRCFIGSARPVHRAASRPLFWKLA
jgi:hypothetical protein